MKVHVGLRGLVTCLIASMTLAAPCASSSVEQTKFLGTTLIGGEQRSTEFAFACSTSARDAIGGLSVTIRVPLGRRPGFDFDAFEGPSGTGQALTLLSARSFRRADRGSFAASGGYQEGNSFSLTVSVSRDDPPRLHALGRVVAPLLDLGTFTWQQSGPHAGEPGFSAELRVRPGDAARLSRALSPCLDGSAHTRQDVMTEKGR